MSTDDDRSVLECGNIVGDMNPFGGKEIHDLLVVDERSVGEDWPWVSIGLTQHPFQGAANSHAKPCGSGLFDLQEISASTSEK
jgi:hypothetical protein